MPRIARKDLGTNMFHVIVQGIAKEYIFEKEEYIIQYLYLIKKYCQEHDIRIIAYCIMNNHAHFMFYAEKIIEMSKAMQRTNVVYSKYYNKKKQRVGYVFRNRYVSEPIIKEEQLLNCIVYIHKNPLKAKIVKSEKEYMYSSYNEYVEKYGIINEETIKFIFGSSKDYKEQFKYIHENSNEEFKDIYNDLIEKTEKICINYLLTKNITVEKIVEDEKELRKFLIEMKEKNNISNRKLAGFLGINREKIRKIK